MIVTLLHKFCPIVFCMCSANCLKDVNYATAIATGFLMTPKRNAEQANGRAGPRNNSLNYQSSSSTMTAK